MRDLWEGHSHIGAIDGLIRDLPPSRTAQFNHPEKAQPKKTSLLPRFPVKAGGTDAFLPARALEMAAAAACLRGLA
jgi:hypothetical protein